MSFTFKIKIQNVRDNILNKTTKELVVEKVLPGKKRTKKFIGPLFFEKDPWEDLKNEIACVTINSNDARKVVCEAYKLLKENDMLKKDTLSTMCHWQRVNGVTEDCITECYSEVDDETLFNKLNRGK